MRNIENWKPSKFVYKNGKLRASRNRKEVGVSSRLSADLVAQFYESALSQYAKGDLLDLGCGKVPLYDTYKDVVNISVCVDWDNTFHKNEFIDKSVDLNKELPFEDETFDTIILSDVLEHIQNPMLLWSEMGRVLRKEGILIMNVPFHYWIHEEPYDYYRYTKFALEYFAKTTNFKILSIQELGAAVEVLTDFISKLIIRIPVIGNYFAMLLQWSNMVFLKSKFGKTVLRKTSNRFILGYALIAQKK